MNINEKLKECECKLTNDNITIATYPSNYDNWLTTPYYRTITWDEILKEQTDCLPKEYYIGEKKKTIALKWNNNTITKVRASKDDKFDVRFGFLLAYFQKHCGLTKTQANKYLEKVEKSLEKEKEKK